MNRYTSNLSGGDRSASSSPEVECSGRVEQAQDHPTLTELCERAESRVDERLYEISRRVKKLEEESSATNGGGKTNTKTKKVQDGQSDNDVAMRDNGAIEALTSQLSEMRASRRQSRYQRRRRHSATRSYESTIALQESISRLNAHCRRRGSSSSLSSSSLGMSSSGFVGRRSSSSIGGVTCPRLAEGALTDLSDAALLFLADDDDDDPYNNDDPYNSKEAASKNGQANKEEEEKKQADDEDEDEWARMMVAASFVDMERERQRDRRSIRRSRDSCLGLGVSDEVMAELAALDDSLDNDGEEDCEVPMKMTMPVPEEENEKSDNGQDEEGEGVATFVVAAPPSLLKGMEEEREGATRSGMANPPRRNSATAATA